ncbi:MAG: ABC transporter ATP-binding protein [Gammaproteobacteria bacterium]|nr:ABC transporter ATP-binding protein [Gammaproteobacteria bacterium]
MLEVSQLTRCYGQFKAVDDVSFSIDKGEIIGLLGHNGAGKTTIMKMLSGFLEPDHGSINVDGLDLIADPKSVQRLLGYLPENLPVYPELTVIDYLDYAADLKGISLNEKAAEVQRAITATDLTSKLTSAVATLSRGFKQRVGVAQAILGQPKFLILDEPTNGLDPEQTEHMRQLIRELAQQATVILSTHIMQEVDALCSRVLILRTGQLAIDARLDDLQRTNHLLVDSSMSAENLKSLTKLEGIGNIDYLGFESSTNIHRYRVTLDSSAGNGIGAKLARSIVEQGYELMRLQPEQSDLETLFREVNQQSDQATEVSHAA